MSSSKTTQRDSDQSAAGAIPRPELAHKICHNCQGLQAQLDDCRLRNKELEDINEKLTQEIHSLMQVSAHSSGNHLAPLTSSQLDTFLPEIELKKSIFMMTASQPGEEDTSVSQPPGINNLKKIQQELRVSKKAEQLAKEKLASTKRQLEKIEKDFAKYREDSDARIESLKTEISILQKHYDQLQNSGNDIDSLSGTGDRPFLFGQSVEGAAGHSALNTTSRAQGSHATAELMKIIEDYSRQNELKAQVIESLSQRLDKKQTKLLDFKKKHSDTEGRVLKLRSSLDNVKAFLKLLNSNFIKTMKSSNSILKDQITTCEKEFGRELETLKTSTETQIMKVISKNQRDMLAKIQAESAKAAEISFQMQALKEEHERQVRQIKREQDDSDQGLKEEFRKKVTHLKDKIRAIREEKNLKSESKDQLRDEMTSKLLASEKLCQKLELQLQSTSEKHHLTIQELQKEITTKSAQIEDFKLKEQGLVKKLEDQEARARSELDKVLDKLEKANTGQFDKELATSWMSQRETSFKLDMQAARESHERAFKELQEINEKQKKDLIVKNSAQEKEMTVLNNELHDLKEKLVTESLQFKEEIRVKEALIEEKDIVISSLKRDLEEKDQQNNIKFSSIIAKNADLQGHIDTLTSQNEKLSDKYEELQQEMERLRLCENKEKSVLNLQIASLSQIIEQSENKLRIIQERVRETSTIETQTELKKEDQNEKEEIELKDNDQRPADSEPAPISAAAQEVAQDQSRANSSRASSYGHQFEGGQEEERSEKPQPQNLPQQQQFRPPVGLPLARPPMGLTPFRPAVARPPVMFRPQQPPRPTFNSALPQSVNSFVPPSPQKLEEPKLDDFSQLKTLDQRPLIEPRIESPISKPVTTKPIKQVPAQVTRPSIFEEDKQDASSIPKVESPKNQRVSPRSLPPRMAAEIQPHDRTSPPREPRSQSIEEEKKRDSSMVAKPLSQGAASQQPPQNANAILDFRSNRFFGMINGFLTFLTRRKTAYTGRPATAMYYDEKKRRYVIQGEEDSDEDVPPPPPPKKKDPTVAQTSNTTEVGQSEKKEEVKAASAAEDLTKPALPGALAARGRGRGRGGPMMNRFPQTFGAGQIAETSFKPPVSETPVPHTAEPKSLSPRNVQANKNDEKSNKGRLPQDDLTELFTTGLDITVNQTILNQTQFQDAEETSPRNSNRDTIITQIHSQVEADDNGNNSAARESEWLKKFSQQQDKITTLKYKISMLQHELRTERDQNEQTIENFTLLCQDLKFKGMDEVEDLQSDLAVLRDQLRVGAAERARLEVLADSEAVRAAAIREENEELTSRVRELLEDISRMQTEGQSLIPSSGRREESYSLGMDDAQGYSGNQAEEEEAIDEMAELKATLMEMRMELDGHRWRNAHLEAEKLAKTLDLKDAQTVVDRQKTQITSLESDIHHLSNELKKIQGESLHLTQEQLSKIEREKEQLRESFLKAAAQEKDRLYEAFRERFAEAETRVKRLEAERQRSDLDHSRALRDKDSLADQLRSQNLAAAQSLSQAQDQAAYSQSQVRDLQAKLTSLQARRQAESEQADSVMKAQLRQVQGMLAQQAEEFASRREEMSQEMDQLRHKLTENIVYLQGEIRKRDELIENSSEFGGDFEMIGEADDLDDSSLIEEYSNRGGLAGGDSLRDLDSQRDIGEAPSLRQSFQMVPHVAGKKPPTTTNRRRTTTQTQALQSQLEETRQQLKQHIQDKLQAEQRGQHLEHLLSKLTEGLLDINRAVSTTLQGNNSKLFSSDEQAHQSAFEERATTTADHQRSEEMSDDRVFQLLTNGSHDEALLHQFQPDDAVHLLIGKVYAVQRGFDSEVSELRHRLKMQQMQLEEGESLRFDLELLADEKSLLEADLSQAQQAQYDAENRLNSLQIELGKDRGQLESQLASQRDAFERRLAKERVEMEAMASLKTQEGLKLIDEVHQQYQQVVLPALKEKHKGQKRLLQDALRELRDLLSEQQEKEHRLRSEAELERQRQLNQSHLQLEQSNEEAEKLREELKYLELANHELQGTIVSTRASFESQIHSLASEVTRLQHEQEESKQEHSLLLNKQTSDFEDVLSQMRAKLERRTKEAKETKARAREALQQMQAEMSEAHGQEILNLRAQFEEEIHRLKKEALEAATKLEEKESRVEKGELERVRYEVQKETADKFKEEMVEKESEWAKTEQGIRSKIEELEQELVELRTQHQEELTRLAHSNEIQALDFQQQEKSFTDRVAELVLQNESLRQQHSQLLENSNEKDSQEQLEAQINDLTSQLATQQDLIREQRELFEGEKASWQALKDQLINDKGLIEEEKVLWAAQMEQLKEKLEEMQSNKERELTEMEEEFKTQTEELVRKLKDKAKKDRKKAAEEASGEKRHLELQIMELKRQHAEALEKLDQGSEISQLQSRLNDEEAKNRQLQSQIDTLQGTIVDLKAEVASSQAQMKTFSSSLQELLTQASQLEQHQSSDEPPNINVLFDLLSEYIQNSQEDKRQMQGIIQQQEQFEADKEQLEADKALLQEEKRRVQEHMEASHLYKVESKLRMIEEERSIITSNLQIQINSLVEENENLKQQLSRYEEAPSRDDGRSRSEEQPSEDHSFKRPSPGQPKEVQPPSFLDSSEIPAGDQSSLITTAAAIGQPQQQRSGIFNSIASFFLTESELDRQQ